MVNVVRSERTAKTIITNDSPLFVSYRNKVTEALVTNPSIRTSKANFDIRTTKPFARGVKEMDVTRFRFNQTPVETPNGVLVDFTLPNSEAYVTGLLEVFVNGNLKVKDTEWEEKSSTQITFIGDYVTDKLTSEEVITLNYIVSA